MSRTRMTVTIVLMALVVVWAIQVINDYQRGRAAVEKGDFVDISGETWVAQKSPGLTGPWLRHRLVNRNGQTMAIHVVEMGRLIRNGEAKVILKKGDSGWRELAAQFKVE